MSATREARAAPPRRASTSSMTSSSELATMELLGGEADRLEDRVADVQ